MNKFDMDPCLIKFGRECDKCETPTHWDDLRCFQTMEGFAGTDCVCHQCAQSSVGKANHELTKNERDVMWVGYYGQHYMTWRNFLKELPND